MLLCKICSAFLLEVMQEAKHVMNEAYFQEQHRVAE